MGRNRLPEISGPADGGTDIIVGRKKGTQHVKRLAKVLAAVGLAAVAALGAAQTASAAEIDAHLEPFSPGYGDRYVTPGQQVEVQLRLYAGSGTVPAGSLNGAWVAMNGATWVDANVREVNYSGQVNHTYTLLSPTAIQADRFNGAVATPGNNQGRHYYAKLQIPADAQPGDVYTARVAIGTYATGNTNVGSPTQRTVTFTVRAPDVTIDTPSNGETVPTNTPTIQGTGQPGQTVTLTDEAGNVVGRAEVGPDGTWSVPTSALADGQHRITATQLDSAGATSTDTVDIIVANDTEIPVADPAVAGGAGVVLLAGAGAYLLLKRRRSLTG